MLLTMEMNNTTVAVLQDSINGNETQIDRNWKIVHFSAVTFLVLVGFIGNTLILVVMSNSKFNKTSTSVYLSMLAICDNLTLFSGPFVSSIISSDILSQVNLETIHISLCWILRFLIVWARYTSSWCLVLITVERMIVILKPHK